MRVVGMAETVRGTERNCEDRGDSNLCRKISHGDRTGMMVLCVVVGLVLAGCLVVP